MSTKLNKITCFVQIWLSKGWIFLYFGGCVVKVLDRLEGEYSHCSFEQQNARRKPRGPSEARLSRAKRGKTFVLFAAGGGGAKKARRARRAAPPAAERSDRTPPKAGRARGGTRRPPDRGDGRRRRRRSGASTAPEAGRAERSDPKAPDGGERRGEGAEAEGDRGAKRSSPETGATSTRSEGAGGGGARAGSGAGAQRGPPRTAGLREKAPQATP